MTVYNLGGPKTAFLTGHLETLLTHVWYTSTVATLSRETKKIIKSFMDRTSENSAGLDFMLHDFGFRGVSSVESAGAGGMAHLVNFKGTDTVQAMTDAMYYYGASLEGLAYSVPATEHSIMTSRGPQGECDVIGDLIKQFPTGILSVVIDSYNDVRCVRDYIGTTHRESILARDGVFVVRPDSGEPEEVTLKLITILGNQFGSTINSKGYRVLNPKVRVLWGDGIDIRGIRGILGTLLVNGWSAENMVFGMGGGLLQKVHRDTQRFAFKCSAQKLNDKWVDIYKDPIDKTKASKRGRLKLTRNSVGAFETVSFDTNGKDLLEVVFENGELVKTYTFAEVRKNAEI
jgi:nicotinamide phosphoribosyltransferase